MIKLADIAAIAAARSDRPAVVSPDYSLSWSATEASVRNLVASLRTRLDLRRIRQAAFVADNRIELVLMMSAFSTLGIPFCGIDYTLPREKLAEAARLIGAECVVLSSRLIGEPAARDLAQQAGAAIDLDDRLEGALPLSVLALPCAEPANDEEPRPFRVVAFTSGTSGLPKPTLRTKSTDVQRFGYFTRRYGFHSDDCFLVNIPLYHVAGNGWARHFMGLGATLHLMPVDSPAAAGAAILARRITAFVTTPANLAGIVAAIEAAKQAHALRFVLVGGKNFGPRQKARALDVLGSVIYEYYGSTETGVNTIAEPADLRSHPASVGRPYAGNQVVILDDANRILPAGQKGRVAVNSYLMMDGYVCSAANEAWVEGKRFLITPDHGYFDAEGRLYVLNRFSGGVGNVDFYTAEDAARGVPGVQDVALLPKDGGNSSASPDCAVVIADGFAAEDVLDEVRRALAAAAFEVDAVCQVDRIPYSLSGKIRAPVLAREIAARAAAPQLDRAA